MDSGTCRPRGRSSRPWKSSILSGSRIRSGLTTKRAYQVSPGALGWGGGITEAKAIGSFPEAYGVAVAATRLQRPRRPDRIHAPFLEPAQCAHFIRSPAAQRI